MFTKVVQADQAAPVVPLALAVATTQDNPVNLASPALPDIQEPQAHLADQVCKILFPKL